MNYEKYLCLDTLLSAQKPIGADKGRTAHDELLFISIHQTYELWFKQILFELDSVLFLFSKNRVDEKDMDKAVSRLQRINKIFKTLVGQVDILETMTPMDFLEFRDLIYAASGFQSYQFRLLENKLGLRSNDRINYNSQPYHAALSDSHAEAAIQAEKSLTLFRCLDEWLSRTPFLDMPDFKFWEKYKESAHAMFAQDEIFINSNAQLNTEERNRLKASVESSKKYFTSLFNIDLYNQMRENDEWRLSYKAVHGALLIQLYRDQPIFQLPFRLITEVLDLDSHLTQWRYRHTLMVKRMLGLRIGTGGSSGANYLRETTEKHKIFEDFFKLTTFFIPRNKLPELPGQFAEKLGFNYK